MGITFLTPTSRKFGFYVGIRYQLWSFSGGSLSVSSTDPFDPPRIDLNLLASEFDIFTYRESVRASQRFFSAPAWKDYVIARHQPPPNATSDEELNTYLRENTISGSHASGTCAMSASDAQYGVVNPDLRVKGIRGLRIVDASIMVVFFFSSSAKRLLIWFVAIHSRWSSASSCLCDCGKGCQYDQVWFGLWFMKADVSFLGKFALV